VISYAEDSLGFDGSCANNIIGVVLRTYYAEDLCGNIDSSCAVTITVQDTTAPLLLTCPPDTTIECASDLDTLGLPTYLDNCSLVVTITFQDDTIDNMPPNLGMIIRTFYGTDACGSNSSCVQTITIEDNSNPRVTQDITVELDNIQNVTIADDCR
jgi:hypothetical protein